MLKIQRLPFRNLLSGSFAGVCAYSLVYPVDTIKTLLATNQIHASDGIAKNISLIRSKFGFQSLYRGLGATCFGIFPYAGLKFFFFNYYRNLLLDKSSRSNSSNFIGSLSENLALVNLISGGLAGCSAVSITYPTDLIRRKRQFLLVDNGGNMKLGYLGIARQIYGSQNIRGFYNGLACTYLKLMPSTALVFMFNELFKGWNVAGSK